MPTRLILIRHGITNWNKKKRYCGHKDVPLSHEGKLQAEQLRGRLQFMKFDRVYASDRKRAMQTAQIIFKGFEITKVPGLKELDFGVLEGLRYEEIKKKYLDVYAKWLADPFRNNIPKAESLNSFKRRVTYAMRKIVSRNHGKNIAVVSHGGTISIFIADILKSEKFWRHIPAAGSMTIVEYKKNAPKIKLFNCSKNCTDMR